MLAISDLHVAYGQSEVLHGLNVSVAPNEIVAIMGRNGMGKTTLMKSLMGILPAKSGSVKMDGAELNAMQSFERVAKGLGGRLSLEILSAAAASPAFWEELETSGRLIGLPKPRARIRKHAAKPVGPARSAVRAGRPVRIPA